MPKTSARASTAPPSICSGAMCAGLPSTCPVDVTPCASSSFAMPKSVSFTRTRGACREVGRGVRRSRLSPVLCDAVLDEHVLGFHVAVHDALGVRVRRARRGARSRSASATSGGSGARSLRSLRSVAPRSELDDEVLLRRRPPTRRRTPRRCSGGGASRPPAPRRRSGARPRRDSRRCGWITLTATSRARRLSIARYTVAIPP